MRHNLAPFRLARYIPWKNAAEKPVVDIKPRVSLDGKLNHRVMDIILTLPAPPFT